jgi:hypothetical protein
MVQSHLEAVIPSADIVSEEFSSPGRCVAIVCGKVSGNMECLDFDCGAEKYDAWKELVEKDAPGLVDRLVRQKTQNGGCHAGYRCRGAKIPGAQKLAAIGIEVSGEGEHEYKGKKLTAIARNGKFYITPTTIETRGEGNYFLAYPSPGYEIEQHKFSQVPEITPQERDILISAAKALNQWVPEPRPISQKTPRPKAPGELPPGDGFNRRGDVRGLLERHGWQNTGRRGNVDGSAVEYWRRPGKDRGQSATLFDNGCLYVFSLNALPFEEKQSYMPFAIYALLEHNGDFSNAAKELSRQGYGDSRQKEIEKPPVAEPIDAETPSERQAIKEEGEAPNGIPATKFEIITLEAVFQEQLVEHPIVAGLLWEDEETILFGPGGVGKSIVSQDIAMALGANMAKLWNRFEIPDYRATMFVQSENGRLAVHQRVILKCQGEPEYIRGLLNIFYAGRHKNIQIAGHVTDDTFRNDLVEFAKRAEDSEQVKIGVIVFDPLISFHDADENDNSRMRTTLDQITLIANQIVAAPVVIHQEALMSVCCHC